MAEGLKRAFAAAKATRQQQVSINKAWLVMLQQDLEDYSDSGFLKHLQEHVAFIRNALPKPIKKNRTK